MRITDIKPTKRAGRYSVYLDGKFGFALGDLELSASSLRIGDELSPAQLAEWQAEAVRSKLRAQTLGYLAIRPRSRDELAQYLRRKGYDAADTEYAQDYAANLGYLDDLAFARSWVESRQLLAPRSRLKLAAELRAKGLDREVIDQALESQDQSAQLAALKSLITKKRHHYGDDQKLFNYCLRQGFSPSLVRQALQGDD